MKDIYRRNAFTPQELRSRSSAYHASLAKTSDIISRDLRQINRDDYLAWVKDWKETYGRVSKEIKILRDSDKKNSYVGFNNLGEVQSERKAYQKIANTLLNARTFAKDMRRINFSKEVLKQQA